MKYLRWALWWMNSKSMDLELIDKIGEDTLSLEVDSERELYRTWLLLARHYFAQGANDSSTRFYQAVLDKSDAKNYQRVEALTGIAKNAIETGNDTVAWDAFRTMIPIYDAHTDGNDFLLLYLFFALEKWEYDEALGLLKLVPKMKSEWIDQSDYSIVTHNLIRSVDQPEAMLEYWNHSEKWWQKWRNICWSYNVYPGDLTDLWGMDDFGKMASKIKSAGKRGNPTDFLEGLKPYVLLARWLPVFLIDTNDFLDKLPSSEERLVNRIREMLLEALTGVPETVDPEKWSNLYRAQLENLVELGYNEEVPAKARKLIESEGKESSNAQSALRIWLNASRAAKKGFDEPAGIMEQWLTGGVEFTNRVWSVRALSNGYYVLNRPTQQIALAERELQNPVISGNEELREVLRGRVNIARKSEAVTSEFTGSVRSWIKENDLKWFTLAEPLELDPSNPLYLKGPIEERDRWDDGVVKGNILFALDESKPIEERRMSFAFAVMVYLSKIHQVDTMEKTVWSALDIPELAEENRSLLVISAIEEFLEALKYKQAEKLLESAYTGNFIPQWVDSNQAVVRSVELYLRLPDEDLNQAIHPILNYPATKSTDVFVRMLLTRMVYLGQFEQAEKVFRETRNMRTIETGAKNIASYRLGWLRTIKIGKLNHAFDSELRNLILSCHDSMKKRPRILEDILSPSSMDSYPDREQMDMILYCISKGIFFKSTLLDFTYDYYLQYLALGRSEDFGMQYLRLIEKHLGNDQIDSRRLDSGINPDFDVPAVYLKYLELTDRLLSNPLLGFASRNVILKRRTRCAIRIQEDLDYEELFDDQIARALDESFITESKIEFLYTREDWGRLDELLKSIDYTIMTTHTIRAMVYDALLKLGREDEAELMLDLIKSKIEIDIRDYWSGRYAKSLTWMLNDVAFLDEPSLLPKGFLEICADRPYDNQLQIRNEVLIFLIQHQWESAISAVDKYLKIRPKFYHFYGLRGYAHAKLKHNKLAKKDLEIFLKYERNNVYYGRFKHLCESL